MWMGMSTLGGWFLDAAGAIGTSSHQQQATGTYILAVKYYEPTDHLGVKLLWGQWKTMGPGLDAH